MEVIAATWSTSDIDIDLAILAGAIVAFIIWVLVSHFVGRAADRKHRSFTAFFLHCFFVSPIVGAIIVAAIHPSPDMEIAKGRMRACGRRAQAIQPSHRVSILRLMTQMPHAGHDLRET